TFVPPFKMARMTWIKPSLTWMLYRSGYGQKPGQECILGIDIKREGFEWALRHATLAHRNVSDKGCVRVQWDPERTVDIEKLDHRSIQIGLSGEAVERYVKEWIVGIEDITALAHTLYTQGHGNRDTSLLPQEKEYPVPEDIRSILEMGKDYPTREELDRRQSCRAQQEAKRQERAKRRQERRQQTVVE
ncbi:protein of unknown function DUF4291, partial [Kipferlia bialata]